MPLYSALTTVVISVHVKKSCTADYLAEHLLCDNHVEMFLIWLWDI